MTWSAKGSCDARRFTLISSRRARLLVDALQHNVGDPLKLIPVYALLSRIRLNLIRRRASWERPR